MADKQTILSFERSSSFLLRRADRRRREGRLEDALSLFRRLNEASPAKMGAVYQTADLLCDMGRPDQAMRELGRIFSEDPESPDGMYLLARCLLMTGCDEGAKEALTVCLNAPHESKLYARAADELCRLRALEPYAPHRTEKRALRLAQRAYDALTGGDFPSSVRLADRSLASCPDAGVKAVRRLARACMRPSLTDSVQTARRYADRESVDLSFRLTAAALLPDDQERERFLRKAAGQIDNPAQIRLFVTAAAPLNARVQTDLLSPLLARFPFDRNLLHALAVCTLRTGGKTDEAIACWQRMLTIDPGDAVAAGCLALHGKQPHDAYALPLLPVLTNRISAVMRPRFEQIALLPESERMPLLRWAKMQPDCAYTACRLTEALFPRDAEALLRADTLDPQLPCASRMLALSALKARAARPPFAFPEKGLLTYDPLSADRRGRLPIPVARVLRYALLTIGAEYPQLTEPLARRWFELSQASGAFLRRMGHPRAMAAALSFRALHSAGLAHSLPEIAARFGCTPRRVKYCLNILNHHIREDDTFHETH